LTVIIHGENLKQSSVLCSRYFSYRMRLGRRTDSKRGVLTADYFLLNFQTTIA